MMPKAPPVPKETKKIIRDLWMKGHSALYIGNQLGKTRRSVIGTVWRLGLMRVARPPNPSPTRKIKRNQFTGRKAPIPLRALLGHSRSDGKPVTTQNVPMPAPTVAAKTGYRTDGKLLDLMGLKFNSCRWPIGDPQLEGFGYCGAQTQGDLCPYCVIHKKIAYYAGSARRI